MRGDAQHARVHAAVAGGFAKTHPRRIARHDHCASLRCQPPVVESRETACDRETRAPAGTHRAVPAAASVHRAMRHLVTERHFLG
eukprot:1137551-Prymnesium_polylepis.2